MARKPRVSAIIDAIVDVSLGTYIVAGVFYAFIVLILVIAGQTVSTYPENLASLISSLARFLSPLNIGMIGFPLAAVAFASVISLETLGVKPRSLLIAVTPITRLRFLAASYIIAVLLATASSLLVGLLWGIIDYYLLPASIADPLTFGLSATILCLSFMVPNSITILSIASIIASKFKFTSKWTWTILLLYLIVIPVILSITIPALLVKSIYSIAYVLAVLAPGTGIEMYVAHLMGVTFQLEPEVIVNLNYNLILALSITSITLTMILGVISFTRNAEVKGI